MSGAAPRARDCRARSGSGPGRNSIGCFRRGARVESPAFVLLWRREPGPRAVGFAVGRRLGGSVDQEPGAAASREAYRRHRELVPQEGIRLCFIARRPTLTSPFEQLDSTPWPAPSGQNRSAAALSRSIK